MSSVRTVALEGTSRSQQKPKLNIYIGNGWLHHMSSQKTVDPYSWADSYIAHSFLEA
jgi:hypothetical protein